MRSEKDKTTFLQMPFTTTCFRYSEDHPIVGSIGTKKFKLVDHLWGNEIVCGSPNNQNHNLFVFQLSFYFMVSEFVISTTMFKNSSTAQPSLQLVPRMDPFHFQWSFSIPSLVVGKQQP